MLLYYLMNLSVIFVCCAMISVCVFFTSGCSTIIDLVCLRLLGLRFFIFA